MISKINSNASKCCCKTHEKAMTYRMQVIKGNVCIKEPSLQLEIEHTCTTVVRLNIIPCDCTNFEMCCVEIVLCEFLCNRIGEYTFDDGAHLM